MNTEIIIHPKLHHYGLVTANMDAMLDWYRKVLGMTVNYRTPALRGPQEGPRHGPPFSAAFTSNDEINHRLVFFEMPGVALDPEKRRHVRLQHVAFQYDSLDDLLGTYARLKGLGILPVMTADQGLQMSIYYEDPDQNNVELHINNYGNEWTATEHIKGAAPAFVPFDPDKLLAARKAGASPWEIHERTLAGEFVPEKPYDPLAHL
jgi:catechol 2,3-dioxygenase